MICPAGSVWRFKDGYGLVTYTHDKVRLSWFDNRGQWVYDTFRINPRIDNVENRSASCERIW